MNSFVSNSGKRLNVGSKIGRVKATLTFPIPSIDLMYGLGGGS